MLEDAEFRAFLKALGARIRRVRKAKNLDMRHIMITSGYYDAQWRKYETGGSLTLQSLLKIALTLEVPLDQLFDGLGQWPALSVEEIENKRGLVFQPEQPQVDSTVALEATEAVPDGHASKAKFSSRGVKVSGKVVKPDPAKTAGVPASRRPSK